MIVLYPELCKLCLSQIEVSTYHLFSIYQGEVGAAGAAGVQGIKGEKGVVGDTGSRGQTGPPGLPVSEHSLQSALLLRYSLSGSSRRSWASRPYWRWWTTCEYLGSADIIIL